VRKNLLSPPFFFPLSLSRRTAHAHAHAPKALATSTEVKCLQMATTPYEGQKPGTSGLRKKVSVFFVLPPPPFPSRRTGGPRTE